MSNYLSGVEIIYFSYFFEGYMMTFCCLPQLNAPKNPPNNHLRSFDGDNPVKTPLLCSSLEYKACLMP